jgi:hypothetical protein
MPFALAIEIGYEFTNLPKIFRAKQCCGSGIQNVSGFNGVSGFGFAIRIQIQEFKNGPEK